MLLSLALFFAGCQKYDDSTLNGRVDDLEGRVTELEKQIADLNSNVQTVSASVKALENEDRIVSITPLADGTGYEIEFSKMGKMVIKNGEKPSVSVEKGEDGIYYWTVDGEPLLAGGNRIPATIAPEFKIEDGQLWFRLNGGEWTVIPGAETGIGLVQDVTETDEDVTLVLSDGREITIPKVQSFALKVEAPYSGVDAGETVRVAYTVTAGDAETVVKAICDEGFTARVSGDSQSGAVSITAPDPVPSSASVVLVAVNGKGQMSGKILSFEQGQLSLVENTLTIGNQGGEITLAIKTNMAYTTMIDPASGWITDVPVTKALRTDELKFNVEPYDGSQGEKREGKIYVSYGSGKQETFTVVQLNSNVVSGGKSDFETFNNSGYPMTYIDPSTTTDAGWHLNEYGLVLKPTDQQWSAVDHLFPVICSVNNGGTIEMGSLYSPELEGGCGQLTINYGTSIYDVQNLGFGFKVIVSNGIDTPVEFEIRKSKEDIAQYQIYEEIKDINLSGKFDITITNLGEVSSSMAILKLPGSVSIISVEWTGYSE